MDGLIGNTNTLRTGTFLKLGRRRLDGRTKVGMAINKLRRSLVADLGGEQEVTTAQRVLIDRIVVKVSIIGFFEQAIMHGDSENYRDYSAVSSGLRADLALLGLKRREKDVMTLVDYIEKDKK